MASVSECILADSTSFDFFSAVDLIEQTGKQVKCTASANTAFPASDIAGAHIDNGTLILQLAFMGLCGSSSPLPNAYIETALREFEAPGPYRALLDIFHNRLYRLLFDTLCHRQLRRVPALRVAPASAAQLASVLSAFTCAEVRIRENTIRWAPLPDRPGLGYGIRLGSNTVLGDSYRDRCGGITIEIGPLGAADATRYRRGGEKHEELRLLVHRFIHRPLDMSFSISIQTTECRRIQLASKNGQLGINATLGAATSPPVLA